MVIVISPNTGGNVELARSWLLRLDLETPAFIARNEIKFQVMKVLRAPETRFKRAANNNSAEAAAVAPKTIKIEVSGAVNNCTSAYSHC